MVKNTRTSTICKAIGFSLVEAAIFSRPSNNAYAADQTLQLIEPFYEAYLDNSPPITTRGVVGVTIVGLKLESPSHLFEPKSVRVILGRGRPRPEQLCAKFISRDGRYFARGQYRLSGVSDPSPLLNFQTRYAQQLKGYVTNDFAMFAVAGKSCESIEKAQLFVVHDGDLTNAKRLLVQIRAGDARVHAQLGHDNIAVGPAVLCERPSDVSSVGFSAECSLPLPSPFSAAPPCQ